MAAPAVAAPPPPNRQLSFRHERVPATRDPFFFFASAAPNRDDNSSEPQFEWTTMAPLKFARPGLFPSPERERTRQVLQTVCMALALASAVLLIRAVSVL
ncbi:MAG: hypothetical protein NTAFB05_30420 [Nitrobacter sp.]